MLIETAVSKVLIQERQRRGLKQHEMRAVCGLSQATICEMENGGLYQTAKNLKRIADGYGLTLAALIEEAERLVEQAKQEGAKCLGK